MRRKSKRMLTLMPGCVSLLVTIFPAAASALAKRPSSKSSSVIGDIIVWILSHLPLCCFGFVAIMLIISIIVSGRKKRRYEQSVANDDSPFSVSIVPVRTVYDEQQRVYRQEVISDTSNGRVINGHSLRTREDWDEWGKFSKQARDCYQSIREMMKELQSKYCENPEDVLNWIKSTYSEYERLCYTYGMWNSLIDDHAVYVPTPEQKKRSRDFIAGVEALIPNALQQRDTIDRAREITISYLDGQPRKETYKTDLSRELSSKMEVIPTVAAGYIRVLCNLDILREFKNEKGRIMVRKARKRTENSQQ